MAAPGDVKPSSRRPITTKVERCEGEFPCPREVKPLLFFYKYLQPIGADGSDHNANAKKLRVNLPLTVVCERSNAQELVLWLRTDAQGNVIREEKTPLWRKKLHNDLLPGPSLESDPVLAVRCVGRWKNSNKASGSAVVLTGRTLDPVVAVPCELPTCIQQFIHCRGSQASVYRIFWFEQERKCFAVNLTSSLKNTEIPEDVDTVNISASNGLSASTMAAMNAAFEAAMATAAQTARFYCVTVSPDARACARWPKLRGAAIAEGVQATIRIVDHVQLQLPTLRFHSMTTDFIKDTNGVWWLTRVVDFQATSSIEPLRDDSFSSRDSAVLIPEALRSKHGANEPQDAPESPKELSLLRGDEFNNALNTRSCFLCGSSCELTPTFRAQLEAAIKGHTGEKHSAVAMQAPAVDEFRMTLTMALDTIFLMRQRGVNLPVWENAVSTVRKSQLRDVCDFPTCMLCYRVYQQQNQLQLLARELHSVLSPNISCKQPEEDEDTINLPTDGIGMATSAASGLAGSQLLSSELRYRQETPKSILDHLEAFRTETIPASLLRRADSPEMRPTWSVLTPVRGADVDPTATQLRMVFFFHELQDGGPDLIPTDFYLEYHLGQNVTRVQLEGSKMHTPNRWQLCEARVHYLCATLDAFSEFCAHKRLLIKLKAKPFINNDDDSGNNQDDEKRSRDQEEFFGYTLLPFRTVNTAAKWFGNSLQPESRTDYLLELHTASHGLLTLKLTVGLLVDPVPLARVRDVLRDRIFLEEQPPHGVYWPPPSHCLGGLAIPRDWIGALMPSEYTKLLPMRRRETHSTNPVTTTISSRTHSVSTTPGARSLTLRSSQLLDISNTPINKNTGQNQPKTTQESASSGGNPDQDQDEVRTRSLSLAMIGTTLSRACLAAKRIVSRVSEDATTRTFPTVFLAALLRHASFANPVTASCFPSTSLGNWNSPARFQFTRKYSVDRLLAEVKPGSLPMLALLGELLLVLLEQREISDQVDANALESLLEPFWQQDSGWRPIPRTRSSCLPERRVIWNRAIRRWEAATGNAMIDEASVPEGSTKTLVLACEATLKSDIGDFRAKMLALVLCELFEQMETLDNGYIEIAELRSLAKCLPDQESLHLEKYLDEEVGMREKLTQADVEALGELVARQQRLAIRTLLHSLIGSAVMTDALARFDRVGSGEMSLEEFRELASEALLSQRKVFQAFQDEPKKSRDGFCLRHGLAEVYATDSVCVLCAAEFQGENSLPKSVKAVEKSPESPQLVHSNTGDSLDAVQAPLRFNSPSERSPNTDSDEEKQYASRRSSSPPRLERFRRASSGNKVREGLEAEADSNSGPRRRRAITGNVPTSGQMIDSELENMLSKLQAAERTIVVGESPVKERKAPGPVRSRQPSLSTTREENEVDDTFYRRRKSTAALISSQISIPEDNSSPDQVKKKRLKKRILKKTARRVRSTTPLPTSASLSRLLHMELSDRRRVLATSASETIIEKAVRIEQRRKEMDRLILNEVQEVKERLAKLLDRR
ncbi:hypothetical protein P3T76_006407 [Phytophthora citrophthora]|uniref:EF-hand domain-containing protein n=1 Tax=Phytophthora citrophthora TaxID=4793 RepID=A0AAD9GNX1_9STRA|nr:hypothetical protein P3T76_006407 [Phytophthora citrophthora]